MIAWRCALVGSALILMTACGGGDDGPPPAAGGGSAEPPAVAGPDTVAAPDDEPTLLTTGSLKQHPEAGFRVYWPSGCGVLKEQISTGRTSLAEQEFIYSCDRDEELGEGVSVWFLQGARGPDGEPPNPEVVVALIEQQMQRFGVRPLRQRPLDADGIEGVEVQGAEPAGPGEVWLRGLLRDEDLYLLLAWNRGGGLFVDPEMADFFASFRLESR